jgi:MFS family permease
MLAVRRDWAFWVMCLTVVAPSYIGTAVFFQQVHLRELKEWSPALVATAFTCLALTHMIVGLLAGIWVDRFSATRALPYFLLPLAAACLVLSQFSAPFTLYVFMVLLGVSYGLSNIVFGAIWAETYGTANLGAIRAVATASMVLGSALSPGVSGWLIDQDVAIDQQLVYMGSYCLMFFLVLIVVSRSLRQRQDDTLLRR